MTIFHPFFDHQKPTEEMNMDRRGPKKRLGALESCQRALSIFQAQKTGVDGERGGQWSKMLVELPSGKLT